MQLTDSLTGWPSRQARCFLRHLFEMIVAMILGMCILGAAFGALHAVVFGSGFAAGWQRHVELAAFAMAFNMTLPMVLWMRHRGHSWERGGEMAAAMFVPALALLVLFWLGVIPEGAVVPGQMALMLPAMTLVMLYRVDEYSAPHAPAAHGRRHGHAHAA
jgi:flagellar biosynthetic protein FliP